ncbi:MAG TPA: 4'-phosphopantetheinyl transferase superfamily protein [Acidimicrobiales bacterium]|nr:4'-phosphopantetheinyl transferase superfamily protein [Acidimicrobiales bacterium]
MAAPAGDSASGQDGGIELWVAPLDLAALENRLGGHLLSPEERERAEHLRFESDRAHFIAGRLWLRLVLAQRLGIDPSEVRLRARPGGKPELAAPLPSWLRFSMSRSGSVGLYALADAGEIGVDLEERSGVIDAAAVASRFFSPAERAALAGLDEEERRRAFYRIWARKEAALKALGAGLDAPLGALDVAGDVASWDRAHPGAPTDPRNWFLHDIEVAPGYAAALATEAVLPRGVPAVGDARQLLGGLLGGKLGGQSSGGVPNRARSSAR